METGLGLVLQPRTVGVPEPRPVLLEGIERQYGSWILRQQEASPVGSVAETGEPDPFCIVEVTESGENAGVRKTKVALQFLAN